MPINMDNVHCSVGELNLLDCSYDTNTTHNTHLQDVGIKCRKCKLLHVNYFAIAFSVNMKDTPYNIYRT